MYSWEWEATSATWIPTKGIPEYPDPRPGLRHVRRNIGGFGGPEAASAPLCRGRDRQGPCGGRRLIEGARHRRPSCVYFLGY